MVSLTRRGFLTACAGAWRALELHAAPARGRVKVGDVKVMVLQGPRTYTLVKVVSDAGISGVGEAFGSPAVGVKEGILDLRTELIGADPLDIEGITVALKRHADVRAISGIEAALWDLAGRILGLPACTLLGGRFRARIRLCHEEGPKNMLDKASVQEWAERMKKHPAGFSAFKLGLPRSSSRVDAARDGSNRALTMRELREIRRGLETCRDAIGADYDLIVDCGGDYDFRTAVQLAEAVQTAEPLWIEDPMPAEYSEAWTKLAAASRVSICTGKRLGGRHGFREFLANYGCDVAQIDARGAGGLLEAKKIADFGDTYYLPVAAHDTGSVISAYQTAHWAAAARDFLMAGTATGRGNWMDDLILHEGPVVQSGHLAITEKPGFGVDLNSDVVKANLAKGEKYWG